MCRCCSEKRMRLITMQVHVSVMHAVHAVCNDARARVTDGRESEGEERVVSSMQDWQHENGRDGLDWME